MIPNTFFSYLLYKSIASSYVRVRTILGRPLIRSVRWWAFNASVANSWLCFICTPTSFTSCSKFILSSINLMIDTSKSVFPNQQNTYSKILKSSCSIRAVMPWENGVSTTNGIWEYLFLMLRAISNVSLLSVPGIQMTRSNVVFANCFQVSSSVDTCVKRGG